MPDNTSVIQYLLEHYDIAGHNNVQVCLYNSLVARRAGIYDEAQVSQKQILFKFLTATVNYPIVIYAIYFY